MPTGRNSFAIAAYQNKIYCIGGFMSTEWKQIMPCNVVEVYDTVTNSWSTKTSIPSNGTSMQASVVNGKIFVIDGRDLFMYDPDTDFWTKKTSIPTQTSMPADPLSVYMYPVEWDNKLIVNCVFLIEGNQFHGEVMIYDPDTDVWSEGKKTGTARLCFGGVGVLTSGSYAPQRIYVLGMAVFDSSPFNTNQVYDPISDTWAFAEAMPVYRKGFSVTIVDDLLYVIGGYNTTSTETGFFLSLNEQYVPLGYKPQNYPNTQPSATAPPTTTPTTSDITSSPNPPGSFLTSSTVIATTVLTICIIITTLFFYLRTRKKNQRATYE
jgi:hypothetical protein